MPAASASLEGKTALVMLPTASVAMSTSLRIWSANGVWNIRP